MVKLGWKIGLVLLVFIGLLEPAVAQGVGQRDWMKQLVDTLGWSYGLPDEPTADDYLFLLSGQRSIRVEAEESRRRSDRVAVKRLANFGQYSGSGWVSGRREPVELHLDFLLRHSGHYRLSVATRLPGVKLQVAGREFTANAGTELKTEYLGEVDLAAGSVEVLVQLPPGAGIDFLQLVAKPLPAIAPLAGWRPEQPLLNADLALTTLQALELLSTLPDTGQRFIFEAEAATAQPGVQVVADRHLGVPSGGHWIRAGNQPVEWVFLVSLPRAGCYQLVLRGIGGEPTQVDAPGFLQTQLEFGAALTDISVGRICLPAGELRVPFKLPPWNGIDRMELRELDTSAATLTRLLGLSSSPTAAQLQTVNEVLLLLAKLLK